MNKDWTYKGIPLSDMEAADALRIKGLAEFEPDPIQEQWERHNYPVVNIRRAELIAGIERAVILFILCLVMEQFVTGFAYWVWFTAWLFWASVACIRAQSFYLSFRRAAP